jgi:hypothetical protein
MEQSPGIDHWIEQRRRFTQGHTPYVPHTTPTSSRPVVRPPHVRSEKDQTQRAISGQQKHSVFVNIDYDRYPDLKDVQYDHLDSIYDSILQGRRFLKPMPLGFITQVLVHGWRREKLVPRDV